MSDPTMSLELVEPQQADAFCPHCFLVVGRRIEGAWPPTPVRCPHCRLLIGAGRARDTSDAAPGARGAAAGVFAHHARDGATAGDGPGAEAVGEAIRMVADTLGVRPERLLMVDYQQRVLEDPELPELGEVFAAYGTWKHARREAAESAPAAA